MTIKDVRRTVSTIVLVLVLMFTVGTVSSMAQSRSPVTLRFMNGWDGSRAPLMDEVIARFEERYPWITVEQWVVSPHLLDEQLTVSIASGLPPDVAMISFNTSLVFGKRGALLPLSDFAMRDGLDLDQYFYPPVVSMLTTNPIAQPGTFYYLPQMVDTTWFLYYNRDHFAEAGLAESAVPKTWSELETIARRLNRTTDSGHYTRLGIDVAMVPYLENPYNAWLTAAGGEWFSSDMRKVVLNDVANEGVNTLQWMVDFTNEVNGGVSGVNGVNQWARTGFYQGTHSMFTYGVWAAFEIAENAPGIDFGIADLPHRDGYDFFPPMTLGWGYGIPANAPHPEEAWLLVQFLTTELDGGGYFMMRQGRPGATIEINRQPEYFEVNPYWPIIQFSLLRAVPSEYRPSLAGMNELVQRMVQDAVHGNLTPQAAVERLAVTLQSRLDEFWEEIE